MTTNSTKQRERIQFENKTLKARKKQTRANRIRVFRRITIRISRLSDKNVETSVHRGNTLSYNGQNWRGVLLTRFVG